MSSMKSLFNIFMIAMSTLVVVSCVPKATENKAVCGKNQAFDNVTRSCYSIEEARRVPVGTASSAAMSEETPATITLTYTDANLDQAKTCNISSVSSNIEVMSPWITGRGLFTGGGDLTYQAAYNLAAAIPAGVYSASALTAKNVLQAAYLKAQTSLSNSTILAQMIIVKAQINVILGIATNYSLDPTVQSLYTLTQTRLTSLNPKLIDIANLCACTGGVCTTVVVPKLNKNGAAGFSYTVTDVDGASALKAVGITISPMSTSASHLRPVVQSSYLSPALAVPATLYDESATSTPRSYPVTLGTADDIAGTAASVMRYYFSGSKNGSNQGLTAHGKVQDCMDLVGSSGLTDRTCTYTPTSGDANDSTVPVKASANPHGDDLVFTAVSEGLVGNNFTVQYFDLTTDNTGIDSYVTPIEKFGLVNTNYNESFVRVTGNAIKVFINPGLTTSTDIQNLINNHPQAKHLVVVSGAVGLFPVPSVVTPSAVALSGGVDGYDTIPYYANNLLASSTNTASAMLRIVAKNDIPMVPKTYNSLFSQTENFLEEETRVLTLGFTDVDNSAGFTVSAKIDTTIPTCATGSEASISTYFAGLVSSTNFIIGAPGAFTCNASGVCTFPMSVAAQTDFTGNACLYYTITDPGAAVSYVQGVNIVVTGINDVPQLSATNTLPIFTALLDTNVNEDLAVGLPSYSDIYAGPGGGVFEASQLLTVTAVSSVPLLVPNVSCKNYTPVTSSPIGSVIPSATGIYYFDTVNYRCYVSTGTTDATKWALYPSLTVYPNCAYDYYGQGAPAVTPSAAGKHYLDTTNNKCYKSASTSAASWSQDATIANYKIAYVPIKDKSGVLNIAVTVKDNGGTANAAVDTVSDTFQLTVNPIDDPPVFLSTITSVETNEGGAIQSNGFQVDEDEGSTVDEDAQAITITSITTDNAAVLPVSAIKIFYDLNDNGVEDTGEARLVGAMLEAAAGLDAKLHKFYLKLDPVDGVSGNANITLTISDGTTPVSTSFSFIVHPVAALHGGWTNISSVGLKTDKTGAPVAAGEIQCNYNKLIDSAKCAAGTAACTGTTSPNSTILPDAANVIYWDSAGLKCYRSTGATVYSWVEMNTSCPISRTVGSCTDNNCITNATPVGATTPAFVGQYILNSTTNTCYVSTGTTNTDWITYVPAKVSLSWKPYIMVGSGADSGVQIAGWNVYRREQGADYNFKGGHLKNTTSTSVFSITDPTVRTFTDTTAIAGKVYYYVVRPVDTIRNFPTYTPETFSEVRVLASPANYSFVHRWIVNQEICNGMNITNTTSPYAIDQTNNFRCPYVGPGSTGGFYDYGRDLLVDTQEAGCPYAVAPKCTANGCVGIGAPSVTAGLAADDLYYDRGAGSCYRYNGATWNTMETAAVSATLSNLLRTALNAPLVNITEGKASAICTARAAPAGTQMNASFAAHTANLPNKKDFNAYASQKLNITDPEVTELEQGFSLNIQSRCNGSSASGLDTAFTDSAIPSTSFIYSLPGTFSSGIRSLYTGSIPWGSSKGTGECVSRFGIQDLYGNVAEWTQDQVTCDAGGVSWNTCTAVTTATNAGASFVAGDTAGETYAFNSRTGPYNDVNADKVVNAGDGFLTNWAFADEMFGAGKFSYPLALPINDEVSSTFAGSSFLNYVLDVGPSNGITTNKLHEDGIIINNSALASSTASFAMGGSYLSGNRAGRFSSELIKSTLSRPDVGLRCVVPVNKIDYPADANHTYPY